VTEAIDFGFRVLWLVRGEVSPSRLRACLEPLEAALVQARAKWPGLGDYYDRLTVVWPWPEAPPEALVETASRRVRRLEVTSSNLAARCDVAVGGSLADIGEAGLLPILFAPDASSEEPLFDVGGPHALFDDGRRAALAPIKASTENLLDAVFAPPGGVGEMGRLLDYLAEDPSKRVRRSGYALLLRATGSRPQSSQPPRPDPWLRALDLAAGQGAGTRAALESLHAACTRADAVAVSYGERWRSSLVGQSLTLAIANLTSGLIGALFPKLAFATIPIQFATTIVIFLDKRVATRGRWRAKWLEYRTLAEQLRVERFLALCGAVSLSTGASHWVEWLVNRVAYPVARPPEGSTPAALQYLVDVEMADQIDYHQGASQRFGGVDRRIRGVATTAFVGLLSLAAVVTVLAFTPYAVGTGSPWSAVGLALSVAPGLQATLNGVRRDLDVARQFERSARIARNLKDLAAAIAREPQDAATARAAARRAADIMNDDVKGWRTVYEIL
jgi:hypothetical protein